MKNKNQKYWMEIEIDKYGAAKVMKANKLVALNQYKKRWRPTDSRSLARMINNSDLIIN